MLPGLPECGHINYLKNKKAVIHIRTPSAQIDALLYVVKLQFKWKEKLWNVDELIEDIYYVHGFDLLHLMVIKGGVSIIIA